MNKRIDLIDELRGVAIILMIVYHFIYQGVLWVSWNNKILDNQILEVVRISSEFIFISISGVSSSFSKDNYRRGLKCIYCGILITIVTYFYAPEELISFGILHFLGISMILYELFKNRIPNIKYVKMIPVFLIFFILTYLIFYEGTYLNKFLKMPFIAYLKVNGYLNFIGIKSNSFVSSDYFPIVPWIFLFFAGGFYGEKIKNKNIFKEKTNTQKLHLLSFLGKHSFFIYMIHIPVIIGILYLVNYIF